MGDEEAILAALGREAPHGLSGADLCKATGIGSHRVYPALAKLEADRAISSAWAFPEPMPEPRKRLYWLAGAETAKPARRVPAG